MSSVGHSSKKHIVSTELAPAAIGPYSQAVIAGGFLFCSGQIPLDPKTKSVVGQDVESQTTQVIANIRGLLSSQGLSLDDVVKATVYLADMDLFARMNAVYTVAFGTHSPPARSTLAVKGLPMGVLVEIEVIAQMR